VSAAHIFNAQAGAYDDARRRLIPPFDAFYGTAVEALRLVEPAPRRVLDLGAGTGLLARFVRAAYPEARLTLTDGAAAMLDKAREQLGAAGIEYVVADLDDPLPDGPWDAVVSALAIHHLEDDGKRRLFARVHEALRPGGVFADAEQVAGPTPYLTALYARWHEASARASGSDDAEWAAAEERMRFDRCASVEDQLRWLREAGFADADALFQDHRFAVLVARKPIADGAIVMQAPLGAGARGRRR
jgi:tRNA (cmo5U34)-methyltransferase